MASSATPYGLKPVKKVGGEPWNGAFNTYLIDPAGEATNIYTGQAVYVGADGYIAIVTTTGEDATTNAWPAGSSSMTGAQGVFIGCEYVNAQGQLVHSPYYPTGYAAPTGTSIKAFVVDDPMVIFQVQANGAVEQSDLGYNTHFTAAQSTSTGSTSTGLSNSSVNGTGVATTAPFKIVGFADVTGFSTVGDDYTDILVKINPGWHSLTLDIGL